MEIKLQQGAGDIAFGMPVEDIVGRLGNPDEVENIDNAADESTTVLRYLDLGMTFFCEGDNPELACIDVTNEDCTLFGKPVFDMEERAIVQLMVANNYTEEDADEEDWGERRITFPEANVDFYFDQGDLVSIIFGQ
ncbi:MAG: hypothetical protein J6I49_08555 [Bacteroidales bacterium]|nr:hypothetical protein [Bacteroidales bacterium]